MGATVKTVSHLSMATMRSRHRQPLPKPAITDVLKHLTDNVADIPAGYGWVRIHCPFHKDATPSAAVNHQLAAFACHSCSRTGDGLKLLQTELGMSFREACDVARSLCGDRRAAPGTHSSRFSDLLGRS